MNTQAFGPNFSKTKSISVTATTGSATLDATDIASTPSQPGSGPSGGHQAIQFVNAGTKTCFVRWGVGAQTAVTTDMPILAGAIVVYTKSADVDTVAAICGGSDSTTLYMTCGEGM